LWPNQGSFIDSCGIPNSKKITPVIEYIFLKYGPYFEFKSSKYLIKMHQGLRMFFCRLQPFYLVKPFQENFMDVIEGLLVGCNNFAYVFKSSSIAVLLFISDWY
jgi:hypothetical protein